MELVVDCLRIIRGYNQFLKIINYFISVEIEVMLCDCWYIRDRNLKLLYASCAFWLEDELNWYANSICK